MKECTLTRRKRKKFKKNRVDYFKKKVTRHLPWTGVMQKSQLTWYLKTQS